MRRRKSFGSLKAITKFFVRVWRKIRPKGGFFFRDKKLDLGRKVKKTLSVVGYLHTPNLLQLRVQTLDGTEQNRNVKHSPK